MMLKWFYESNLTPNLSQSARLKRMLHSVYGSNVNVSMVLIDIWNVEMWFQHAREQHMSKKEIVDCCGPFGNLHFLMLLLYKFLGYMSLDMIFWFKTKKNLFLSN